MKNIIFRTIFIVISFFSIAAVNPKDLIKVTHETEKSCVEYYDYQGEMYCSTKPLMSQRVDPEVRNYVAQKIVFDHRPWQVAWGKKTAAMAAVEYVPMGDDINNWNELITSQAFPGLQNKTSPKEFADFMMNNLKDLGFNPIVTFISETPTTVIFEFQIDSPKSQVQDEIQKITKGKNAMYVLHYVVKNKDMGAAARNMWTKNLSEAKVE